MVNVLSLLNREGREFLKQLNISNKKQSMIDSMVTLPYHKINICDKFDKNKRTKSVESRGGRERGGGGKDKSSKRSRFVSRSVLNSEDEDDEESDENENKNENENNFNDSEEDSSESQIYSSDEEEEEEEDEDERENKKMKKINKNVQQRKSFSSSFISKRSKCKKKKNLINWIFLTFSSLLKYFLLLCTFTFIPFLRNLLFWYIRA